VCKVYFPIYFVLFLPRRCVHSGSFWGFIFHFCGIFVKLQMCYNLISGHVLGDFQIATVSGKSLSISHAVVLHNLRCPEHGHVYYRVYMCPPICLAQIHGQDEDHIRCSPLQILSRFRLSWRHANYPRQENDCKLACNCG